MTGRLTRALVALFVLISGIGVGGVAAAETPEPALEVYVQDSNILPGDTVTIEVEGPDANTATFERVVPFDGYSGDYTFWIPESELTTAGIATDGYDLETEIGMYMVDATYAGGTMASTVDHYYAGDALSEFVTVDADSEELTANYTANNSDTVGIDLYNATTGAYVDTLINETSMTAGETVTGTVDASSLEAGEYVVRPPALPTANAELVVGVFNETAGGAVGGDGTSSGSGLETNQMYVIGAVAVIGLLLIMRD
jgi:hypothetical protein